MYDLTLLEIASAVGGRILQGNPAASFSRVSTDTRKIIPGSIFIALTGERFDAHDFLAEAVSQGAGALLVSKAEIAPENQTVPVILVDNTLQALQDLAGFNRRKAGVPVIAITGSAGKTTVKDMIGAVLEQKFSVLKTGGNLNNEIGLPLTLLELGPPHEVAVVEMGMRGRGEIRELARIAQPGIGVISNIGEAHIELLGSVENIARAKGELLEELTGEAAALPGGVAVLNGDDPWLRKLGEDFKGKVVYYGFAENNHLRATEWQMLGSAGSEFAVNILQEGRWVKAMMARIPVPGRHNVLNSLAAIAVGLELGLNHREICQGLIQIALSAMRLEIITGQPWVIINDAYNANPAAMRAALEVLAGYPCPGKRIAVLGNMLELGAEAEKGHRSVGDTAADLGVDILLTLGDQAGWIAQQALARGMQETKITVCRDKEQVVQALHTALQPGDVVLVKGSRGMKMEEIIEAIAK